jgi:hypothetical protein
MVGLVSGLGVVFPPFPMACPMGTTPVKEDPLRLPAWLGGSVSHPAGLGSVGGSRRGSPLTGVVCEAQAIRKGENTTGPPLWGSADAQQRGADARCAWR